jgi:hypothetical protein
LCITVPAVIEVCRPHEVQIHRWRRVSPPASRAPQPGKTNPSGQREQNRYSRHASSVPNRPWNSKIVRAAVTMRTVTIQTRRGVIHEALLFSATCPSESAPTFAAAAANNAGTVAAPPVAATALLATTLGNISLAVRVCRDHYSARETPLSLPR